MRTRCLGGFSDTWVPKLLLPPVKIRILGPKRPNLAQNMLSLAHGGLASSFGALLVGGFGSRAVSRKTLFYFILLIIMSQQKF